MELTIIVVKCETYQQVLDHISAIVDIVGEHLGYSNDVFIGSEGYRVETKLRVC